MVLTPQARAAAALQGAELRVDAPGFSIEAERLRARALAAASARESVHVVSDHDADGVRVRYYQPTPEAPVGLVIHLHGGGFVFNDVDTHDAAVRRFANRSGLAMLSVDYRRPPEHRFPAAPDDVSTVVAWLDECGWELLGLDPATPLFVHGDSAGGNLALVAALRHPGRFAGVALIYPFLDPRGASHSYVEEAHGFDRSQAQWYWQQYAASPRDFDDPDLAPLLSQNLSTLPPTLVVTAEHDPCRDDGERLVAMLAEVGVEVTGTRYIGLIHGFWRHPSAFDQAEPLMRQASAFLLQHV